MERDVGESYRSPRLRLTELLSQAGPADWERPVPTCPGWRVRDVLAHLVGIIEDAFAGRLPGPPSPAQTAIQVDRHRDDEPSDLLARWTELAPAFEEALSGGDRWPAFIDLLSHEHDVRTALGQPGFREHEDVRLAAALLEPAAPVTVDLSEGASGDLVLRTTPFELLRLRLGRRSRAQVIGLDWSNDPADVVDDLFVFGPATQDVVE